MRRRMTSAVDPAPAPAPFLFREAPFCSPERRKARVTEPSCLLWQRGNSSRGFNDEVERAQERGGEWNEMPTGFDPEWNTQVQNPIDAP